MPLFPPSPARLLLDLLLLQYIGVTLSESQFWMSDKYEAYHAGNLQQLLLNLVVVRREIFSVKGFLLD